VHGSATIGGVDISSQFTPVKPGKHEQTNVVPLLKLSDLNKNKTYKTNNYHQQ
jgi:hypothetical protein